MNGRHARQRPVGSGEPAPNRPFGGSQGAWGDPAHPSQHLRIKRFIGNSENAVKTQIWCAVATYVLIAIVKKELQLDASLYSLLQILSVSVFEKTPLDQALSGGDQLAEQTTFANQLNLFDF